MISFVIEMGEQNSYTPETPQGASGSEIIENLAVSTQPSAFSQNMKRLRPSACFWVWDWVWVTLGSPKGHARATQGPPKRGARVDLRK
jgi:hypothetical protein